MIKILIVDDHPFVRHGLSSELEKASDIKVVGEAEDGLKVMSLAHTLKPDIVLLDISLPGKNGLDVLKQLQTELPRIKVLILSAFPEKQYAIRCLKNGARGYLTKKSASGELIIAIRKIMRGGKYVSTSLADLLVSEIDSDNNQLPHEELSDREFQILCLFGQGRTVSEIADLLSLSISTVNTHRANILLKMHMDTTAQLIRYVVDHNLVDTEN